MAAAYSYLKTDTLPSPVVQPDIADMMSKTVQPLDKAEAMHSSFYSDKQLTDWEVRSFFFKGWFAVGHTAELAKPGDVKVVDVGDQSFILTRPRKGGIHAFYNACRHRGARVCSKSTSNCKQLVCPYHWWAYRLDGSLKATPPVVSAPEKKETLGLIPVAHVETFAGIIFLNQQPDAAPLSESLGDLPQKLQRYDLDDVNMHGIKEYSLAGNWKLAIENFIDFYHINAVHPALSEFSCVSDHMAYQGTGDYIGFVTSPLTDCGGPGDSGNFNTWRRVNKVEKSAALFFTIFPNVCITIYPHSVYTLITLPTSEPSKTYEQLSLLMAPGAKLEGEDEATYKQKCDALMDFVCQVNSEDVKAIENLQRGMNVVRQTNMHGCFLPEYDWPIHRFHNMILNGMKDDWLVHQRRVDGKLLPQLSDYFEQQIQHNSP